MGSLLGLWTRPRGARARGRGGAGIQPRPRTPVPGGSPALTTGPDPAPPATENATPPRLAPHQVRARPPPRLRPRRRRPRPGPRHRPGLEGASPGTASMGNRESSPGENPGSPEGQTWGNELSPRGAGDKPEVPTEGRPPRRSVVRAWASGGLCAQKAGLPEEGVWPLLGRGVASPATRPPVWEARAGKGRCHD